MLGRSCLAAFMDVGYLRVGVKEACRCGENPDVSTHVSAHEGGEETKKG